MSRLTDPEKQMEKREGEKKPGEWSREEAEYIEHRLREIARWERKISGHKDNA